MFKFSTLNKTHNNLNYLTRLLLMKEEHLSVEEITETELKVLVEEVIVVGLNKHCKCRSDDQCRHVAI